MPSPQSNEGFTTAQVVRITGARKLQLDTWHRTRFLSPSVAARPGSGIPRRYSFLDVVAIRAVLSLRATGIAPSALRKVIKYLRSRKGLSSTELLARTTLVSDGRDVYEAAGDALFSALRLPGQRGLFLLPLDRIVTDVQRKLASAQAA